MIASLVTCNDIPVRNLTSSYVVQVQQIKERGAPAKLDVLWVVDDSSSMCQEQQSLASSFRAFLDVFRKYTSIDMRLAVTSTNVCPKDNKDAVRGKFLYSPATQFPPECREQRAVHCLTDDDCKKNKTLPDSQEWVCKSPGAANVFLCDKPPAYGEDPYPGDVLFAYASSCRYACDREADPAACARVFGKPAACDAVCGSPGGCSVEKCAEEPSFTIPNSCEVICGAGAECENKCVALLGDPPSCKLVCSADDCYTTCLKRSKVPGCSEVCQSSWDCQRFCEAYLLDQAKCQQVCTSSNCYDTCVNQAFPKQDFLCALTCTGASQCTDRCIAEFGQREYRCVYPGNDKTQAGCMLPPPTAYCPPASVFSDCLKRCEILLGRPELGDADPAKNCEHICSGDLKPEAQCECNIIADPGERCRCLAQRDEKTGMPKCGSGVQCTVVDRCLSYIPPTLTQPKALSEQELDEREAECRSIGIPVLDNLVADRYFRAYKAGKWAGDPAWKGLDDATVRDLIFEKLFICQATIGAQQSLCGMQEQGLLAAWMALDPKGENAEQAQAFLREDAYLLIVIVSDEDDCSTVSRISLSDVNRCPCFADTLGCKNDGTCDPEKPGPLYPAHTFVNLYKSLKPDPAQVFFAAIVGDAIPGSATTPGSDVPLSRKRFYECECAKGLYASQTYVCLSSQGEADLGMRYIQVSEGFGLGQRGGRGQLSNICDDRGLRPALDAIAKKVIPALQAICLARPLAWPCLPKCLEEFNRSEECKKLCLAGQDDCPSLCNAKFGNETKCSEVCKTTSQVEVWLTTGDGKRMRLRSEHEEPSQWDYTFVRNAPGCPRFDPQQGYAPENAIMFAEPLEPSDQVEIIYLSEPFYQE